MFNFLFFSLSWNSFLLMIASISRPIMRLCLLAKINDIEVLPVYLAFKLAFGIGIRSTDVLVRFCVL